MLCCNALIMLFDYPNYLGFGLPEFMTRSNNIEELQRELDVRYDNQCSCTSNVSSTPGIA